MLELFPASSSAKIALGGARRCQSNSCPSDICWISNKRKRQHIYHATGIEENRFNWLFLIALALSFSESFALIILGLQTTVPDAQYSFQSISFLPPDAPIFTNQRDVWQLHLYDFMFECVIGSGGM